VPVKNAKIEDLPQITLEELNKYDGVKDPKIYIAIKNIVFDVSKSE
jgi:predicted heme/steroid binding protein